MKPHPVSDGYFCIHTDLENQENKEKQCVSSIELNDNLWFTILYCHKEWDKNGYSKYPISQ